MPDEGPDFFTGKHVAIFGLGLMGGSAAMALKGHCRLLTGIDPDAAAVDTALRHNVVDRASTMPGELLTDADLVILAAPVNTILALINDLPAVCPSNTVVLDFGSTKQRICDALRIPAIPI